MPQSSLTARTFTSKITVVFVAPFFWFYDDFFFFKMGVDVLLFYSFSHTTNEKLSFDTTINCDITCRKIQMNKYNNAITIKAFL